MRFLSFAVGALLFFSNSRAQTPDNTKVLHVKKLKHAPADAEQVPRLLDRAKIPFHALDVVNWPAYPYRPQVTFRVAYTSRALLVHYKISEDNIRAITTKDNGRVWEDACVEFFIAPEGDASYYNFEFNCTGHLLLQGGAAGDRILAPDTVLRQVKRWASLGNQPIDQQPGTTCWELAAIIPYTAFFRHAVHTMNGKQARGNFYKCGDKLKTPHYLSWNPIHLDHPMFHCPEYFGVLLFE